MAKTVADVMKMVKDNEVKFVDFRFTDTRGKEQHVSVPVSHFDEDKFTAGHAFDGSSIAGWKGIEASDMLLMPDPNTANIDPFYDEPTIILTLWPSCAACTTWQTKGFCMSPKPWRPDRTFRAWPIAAPWMPPSWPKKNGGKN